MKTRKVEFVKRENGIERMHIYVEKNGEVIHEAYGLANHVLFPWREPGIRHDNLLNAPRILSEENEQDYRNGLLYG